VSPLWRDEVRITFAAGEVRLRRMQRGLRARCVAEATHAIGSTSDWRIALATLDSALAAGTWNGAGVRVVMSNRLARYAIVPWSDTLTRDAEHLAHARICLADAYGNTGSDWHVCSSDAAPGDARVACALPAALLTGLRAIFAVHRMPVLSVQPALIDAYNRCRHLLPATACWFVNIEPSMLVAARLAPKGWQSVYSARISADWSTELLRLRMFAKLAAQNSDDARVYVDAPKRLRLAAAPDEPGIEWLETDDASAIESERRPSVRLTT